MIDKKARDYLLGIPLWTKKKNTLDEVRHFLKELGNPDEQLNIIHVAGTNGKGSGCGLQLPHGKKSIILPASERVFFSLTPAAERAI